MLRPIVWFLLSSLLCTCDAAAAERSFALLPVQERSALPEWAQPGRMRYARYDGGPVEVCKAFLSGWSQIRQPDAILPCAAVYDDRSIEMLRQAQINWIWVTWSVGFSDESEAVQRDLLRPFIAKCNAAGIRVTAYLSLTNMFIDDMVRRVPASRDWMQVEIDGTPRPYGAAKYDGKPTRILACLNQPDWLGYSRRRLDEAIDAGVSGIFYDNCFHGCKCAVCREKFADETKAIYGEPLAVPGAKSADASHNVQGREAVDGREATSLAERAWRRFCLQTTADALAGHRCYAESRKPGIFVYANTHEQPFMNDRLNAVFSEDGTEPGLKVAELCSNIGLYKFYYAEGDGAKPIRIELGRRIHEDRMDGPMPPRNLMLAVYEAAACQGATPMFFEMGWTTRLAQGEPQARQSLAALASANSWLREHEDLFVNVEPIAKTALVQSVFDPLTPVVRAGKGFVMLQPRHLTRQQLGQFELVVLHNVSVMSDAQAHAVCEYVESGGRVIASGETWRYDDRELRTRPAPGLQSIFAEIAPGHRSAEKQSGAGRCVFCPRGEDAAELLAAWSRLEDKPLAAVTAGQGGVCFNLGRSHDGRRTLVYLLNYAGAAARNVRVTLNLPKGAETLRIHAPGAAPATLTSSPGPEGLAVEVNELDLFGVLEIE